MGILITNSGVTFPMYQSVGIWLGFGTQIGRLALSDNSTGEVPPIFRNKIPESWHSNIMRAGVGEDGGIGGEKTHLAKLRVHVTHPEHSFQNKFNLTGSPSRQKCNFLLLRSKACKRAQKTSWTSNGSYKTVFWWVKCEWIRNIRITFPPGAHGFPTWEEMQSANYTPAFTKPKEFVGSVGAKKKEKPSPKGF